MAHKLTATGPAWGRLFTRSPQSGVKRLSAEVHLAPPGVEGSSALPLRSLQQAFPQLVNFLQEQTPVWEAQLKDAAQVDFELTDHQLTLGSPFPLERSPTAALKIAVSLVEEGVITRREALLRVRAEELRSLLQPGFDSIEVRQASRAGRLLGVAAPGWGGVASGKVALTSKSALAMHRDNQPVILVCERLTYLEREILELVGGVIVAKGSMSATRQFERPCLLLPELEFSDQQAFFGGGALREGEMVSFEPSSGRIFAGALRVVPGELARDGATLLEWADQVRELEIRAIVASPEDVRDAVTFGATGVGLCRIESLFLSPERLGLFQTAFREICALKLNASENLARLTAELEEDLVDLFGGLAGPFAIRLLDAPVSQLLRNWKETAELQEDYFSGPLKAWLHELNPMHGLRCGRLSLLHPPLLELQIRAILSAWHQTGPQLRLQVMMPGVCAPEELRRLAAIVREEAALIGVEVPELGSMLELPRACLMADLLAEVAQFFSFGTGDLTESTCGLSRYDSRLSFLPGYLEQGILSGDPFEVLDQSGVGALMEIALERAKQKRPDVEIGTCGVQATHCESLEFCYRLGLDYVSVPVSHLPVARLMAAQAALKSDNPAGHRRQNS